MSIMAINGSQKLLYPMSTYLFVNDIFTLTVRHFQQLISNINN